MSTHIIHRVAGDLAPFVFVELVGQDVTGWTIKLLGTYRGIHQPIDINHTVDNGPNGQFHFEWGALDLVKGIADWEIDFLPTSGDRFTIPAENTLILQVRGKTEQGPGVLSGAGQQITITQDSRTLKIFDGGGNGNNGVVIHATEAALLATTPADGTIAYAQDTDRYFFRQGGAWFARFANVVEDTTPQLGGDLDCLNLDIVNAKTITFNGEIDNGNSGAAATIDWNSGQKQRITLNAATPTISFTDPPGVSNLMLKVIQDATGGRDPVWPASVKWPAGTEPTWSVGAGEIDIVAFYFDGTSYHGVASTGFA